jgi:hypothetical protein
MKERMAYAVIVKTSGNFRRADQGETTGQMDFRLRRETDADNGNFITRFTFSMRISLPSTYQRRYKVSTNAGFTE